MEFLQRRRLQKLVHEALGSLAHSREVYAKRLKEKLAHRHGDTRQLAQAIHEQEEIVGLVLRITTTKQLTTLLHGLPRKHWGHGFCARLLELRGTLVTLRQNLRDQLDAAREGEQKRLHQLVRRELALNKELRSLQEQVSDRRTRLALLNVKHGDKVEHFINIYFMMVLFCVALGALTGGPDEREAALSWEGILGTMGGVAIVIGLAQGINTALEKFLAKAKR